MVSLASSSETPYTRIRAEELNAKADIMRGFRVVNQCNGIENTLSGSRQSWAVVVVELYIGWRIILELHPSQLRPFTIRQKLPKLR
jgi:hypothetical protein